MKTSGRVKIDRERGPVFPCAVCGGPVRRSIRDVGGASRKVAGGRRFGPALRLMCGKCRYRIYDYPRIAVGFAVVRGDDMLVLTRGDAPKRGWHDFPGGFVEAGEDFLEAGRRELFEETSLRVGRAEWLGVYWDRYFLRGFGYFPTVSFYFVANWRSGVPRAGDDAAGAAWVPVRQLSRPGQRLAWAHMPDVVRDVRRWMRRSG